MEVNFLSFRCWVGLWIGVIATVVVMLEGSFLVRFVTRFTEELFALLISLIFIYEVFKKLYMVRAAVDSAFGHMFRIDLSCI